MGLHERGWSGDLDEVTRRALARWQAPGPTRYPDAAVVARNAAFTDLVSPIAAVERLATGFRFTEGPVWFGDGRYLVFSDIPSDCLMRWDESSGAVSTFRAPSQKANGNCRDRVGRLLTCEHSTRRVTRTEYDGTVVALADSFAGLPLTGPNDVIVHSNGSVWFSDNGAGSRSNYLGRRAPCELPFRIYRLDPDTGELTVAVDDISRPNGLCFSPDELTLYVADTPLVGRKALYAYDVVGEGAGAANGRLFADESPGYADGIRCDVAGNVWSGFSGGPGNDGVAVFAPDGTLLGQVLLPERCANVAFGGQDRNRLFMTASQSLFALYVEIEGA